MQLNPLTEWHSVMAPALTPLRCSFSDEGHLYDGLCVANNKGATATGPVNGKTVPELCPEDQGCPNLGCPAGQWKRYAVSQSARSVVEGEGRRPVYVHSMVLLRS